MEGWDRIAENIIREAMERGVFDDLPGKGQPLDLSRNPFEDPLAPTLRRLLRDNGSTHPLIEARRALEAEMEACRNELRFAWRLHARGGAAAAWDEAVERFRERAGRLNRDIRWNNLRAPIPNFAVQTLDIDAEIAAVPVEPSEPRP
jgi:DnaJ family protein C protein 28